MNESIIFTDIYPQWIVPWYKTTLGKTGIIALFFIFCALCATIWYFWRGYSSDSRRLKKLLKCIMNDTERAADACVEAIQIVLRTTTKTRNTCPHNKCACDEEMLFLTIEQYASLDKVAIRSIKNELITARYNREKPSQETRKKWSLFISTLRNNR